MMVADLQCLDGGVDGGVWMVVVVLQILETKNEYMPAIVYILRIQSVMT